MAVPLSIPLILTLITGIDSMYTVSEVSVKAGASVSIPCSYSQQYRNHVKYLCEGYWWSSCSYAVRTNSQSDTKKYSISDDKNQLIFTVTIKQLTHQNIDYWCAVEIDGADDRHYFHLSITGGTPSLYVDNQEVTGFIGGNITIHCRYTTSGEMKWCKMNSDCVTEKSALIAGTRVNLNTSFKNRFSVTLSGLSLESSGWYYCVKGDFHMPVHLTVTEKPTTAPTITSTVDGETATTLIEPNSSFFDMHNLIIPLSLLILIVIVAVVVWLVLKCKHDKATTSKSSEEAVTYSDVTFKKKTAQGLSVESGEDVTYSCVVTADQKRQTRQIEAKDLDITYATVVEVKH